MSKKSFYLLTAASVAAMAAPQSAVAQADTMYIGQMMLTGATFCPVYWVPADGRLLSIANDTALFALVGTTYGGDGVNTFAVPDMKGRRLLHAGTNTTSGITYYQGEKGGVESVTLGTNEMPLHIHGISATATVPTNTVAGTSGSPNGNTMTVSTANTYYSGAGDQTGMALKAGTVTLGFTGNSQAHENRPPYLAMTWCVATQGLFPSRN